MNNHSKDMLKTLGKLDTTTSVKKITQSYTIPTQNQNEFIIGEEVTKEKIGNEIHHINQLTLGEFVLFDGKICQVHKLFDISNNARLHTINGARHVILRKNCNLFRLLSSHKIGRIITPDRIGTTVNHISKLNNNQWVLHDNKLVQIINYNSVYIQTDDGIKNINLDDESLTTIIN
jgi:hypothetical protein